MIWREGHFISAVVFPKSQSPSVIVRKTSDKPRLEKHSSGYLAGTPHDCQSHENQGKAEKLSQTRRDWETRQLNAMWDPALDPEAEDSNGKANEIQKKVWSLVLSDAPMSVF